MAETRLGENPGPGIFKNSNFMTPDVVGYARKIIRCRVAWVELSRGRGFEGEPIWGVTFRRADGGELFREPEGLEGDPSKGVFFSQRQAMKYLDGFGNA